MKIYFSKNVALILVILQTDVEVLDFVKRLGNIGEQPLVLQRDDRLKDGAKRKLIANILAEFFKQRESKQLWVKFIVSYPKFIF
jgi:hypothetical protein